MEQITDYLNLFLNDVPMIDLRAPVEFNQGAFPGSIGLPLMLDDERALVGTCYKQKGQDAAIALGHEIFSGETRSQRIQSWISQVNKQPDTILYCFRGGLRSQLVQQFLAEQGVHRPIVKGGYKALRRYLISALEQTSASAKMTVVTGLTGSFKTHLINQLPHSVDLEGRANHRGSSFGNMPDPQPSVIDFENALAIDFLKLQQQGHQHFVLEDESRMVGRCCIPLPLYEKMQQAPLVLLEADLETRTRQTVQDYAELSLPVYTAKFGEDQGRQKYADYWLGSLAKLSKRFGADGYREINQLLQQALTEQFKGNRLDKFYRVISRILGQYYDPLYHKHLEAKLHRVVFRGNFDECEQFLQANV